MAKSLTRLRARLCGLLLACGAGAAACASHAPPSADQPQRPVPDLSGRSIMVLPVQPGLVGVPAGLEAELAFWLQELGPATRWTFPPALERILARTPALDIQLRALAVSSFRRAEVRNIGDPLFGDLRRLGAVADARYALLPVAGGYIAGSEGKQGRVELAVALIDTVGGAVLWYGVVAGEPGAEAAPAVTASAAQALARTFFP